MSKTTKPKWSCAGREDGLIYVWDQSIVGTVSKAPNGYWYGYGCEDEWEDVRLGSFDTEAQAKKAVAQWVKENCD